MKRIEFIDGYRGLAILFVILFHAFSRWSSVVPYGASFSSFPLFQFGYLGVNLFFLVSGFVILMSLERSKNFTSFIFKRWRRLFPGMLIATILIYCTAHFLHERPRGIPTLLSTLPGLIFIEPTWLKAIFKAPFNTIEGSFWSIFVEVKFYIIFGLLYFFLGRSKAIMGLLILYACAVFASMCSLTLLDKILYSLSFKQFFWFIGGCYAYLFYDTKQIKYLLFCIAISINGIIQIDLEMHMHRQLIAQCIVVGIFILPIYFEKLRALFCNPLFLFFGFISYPLYLIHENALIAIIIKLNNCFNGTVPHIFLPIISVGILVLIAYFIAKKVEPFIRGLINKTGPFIN